jgi:hypothetical protein
MSGIPDLDQYGKQCPSVVTVEPLAQTWHVKMWRWKGNSIKCESNFMVIFRRTLRGVGYEPEARAGLNPEPGTDQFTCLNFEREFFFQKNSSKS